jgi:TusA-related sulfurtransferase
VDDVQRPENLTSLTPDAILEMAATTPTAVASCAILTPLIRAKLATLQPGQVLEVRVADPTAREDIASWCRLAGHDLLAVVEEPSQLLRCFIRKQPTAHEERGT